jgi:hypothetical protein
MCAVVVQDHMEFLFRVSYVELYDEQIRDLLDTNGEPHRAGCTLSACDVEGAASLVPIRVHAQKTRH